MEILIQTFPYIISSAAAIAAVAAFVLTLIRIRHMTATLANLELDNKKRILGYQLKAGHFPPFCIYGNSTIKQNLMSC